MEAFFLLTTQSKIEHDDNATRISVFMPWGFHGDPHLLSLVDRLTPSVSSFIETGTEAGSTVAYIARMYPHLQCYTCEADPGTHDKAKENTSNIPNIHHACQGSREWLQAICPTLLTVNGDAIDVRTIGHEGPPPGPALFWLDAHSHGFGCPLGIEVNTILSRWSSGYILMDDFQVPDRPDFGYDWYDTFGKVNWETISKDIEWTNCAPITQAFYPCYPAGHGTRGWMLLVFGDVPALEPIEGIMEKVDIVGRVETYAETLERHQRLQIADPGKIIPPDWAISR